VGEIPAGTLMDFEAPAANKKAVEGILVPNKMPEVSSIKDIAANASEAVEGKQVPSKMQGVTSTSNLLRIPVRFRHWSQPHSLQDGVICSKCLCLSSFCKLTCTLFLIQALNSCDLIRYLYD
jgi:hypothetical protein